MTRAPDLAPAERALSRMRKYTSATIVVVVALYSSIALFQALDWRLFAALAVTSVAVTVYSVFWEKSAPRWLSAVTFALAFATWCFAVAVGQAPGAAVLLAVAMVTYTFSRQKKEWIPLIAATVVASYLPLLFKIGSLEGEWFIVPAIAIPGAIAVFGLNRYGFSLYLEIDAARRAAAELAVVQERYRFAADLHDIQGHTLHVIRLKTQLADKLIDSDAAAAHEQLREAQELIAQTLADTKSLAFGERHVAFASELANAEALITAAGIEWQLEGTLPRGPHDELFGLVMREATTNILRHAQATSVRVRLEPGILDIRNDGSPATPRSLSGLARLGERFEAISGTLETRSAGGQFETIASAP